MERGSARGYRQTNCEQTTPKLFHRHFSFEELIQPQKRLGFFPVRGFLNYISNNRTACHRSGFCIKTNITHCH